MRWTFEFIEKIVSFFFSETGRKKLRNCLITFFENWVFLKNKNENRQNTFSSYFFYLKNTESTDKTKFK